MLEAWTAVLSLSGMMPLEPPDTLLKVAVLAKPPGNPEPVVLVMS